MESEEWHLLQKLQNSARSPLLVKTRFDKDKYEIKATDLIQVWSECLDKPAITSRAHRLDCSIDPGEDASQLAVFLQKIEAGVLEKDGTSMTATLDEVENCITLSMSSDLPKPLKPLRWSIYLRRLPSEAIRTEVITPLMYGSFVRHKQLERLETLLEDKDSAIGKFADKVEGVGVDLSSLFLHGGAARGKKQVSREQLFKHIRGLNPFDKKAWEHEWQSELQSHPSFVEIAQQSLGHCQTSPTQLLWDDNQNPQRGKVVSSKNEQASQSSLTLEEAQSQEFQSRTSPPRTRERLHREVPGNDRIAKQTSEIAASAELANVEAVDDETTEDEGEDHVQSPKHALSLKANEQLKSEQDTAEDAVASREALGARQGRKLGEIGGTKTQPEEHRSINDEQPTTAVGSQEGVAVGDSNNISTTPKRKKLGVIGGKKSVESTSKDRMAEQEPAPDAIAATSTSTARDQIDNHGSQGDSEDLPADPPKDGVGENARTSTNSKTPEAEEDAQEKANRKRQELKRDLETRTKQTSKKKRKF